MGRSVIAAGNWKMNKLPSEACEFVKELRDRVKGADTKIIIAVPFVALDGVVREAKGTNIKVAAQNMHWEDNGAFTGEVSAKMLRDIGVEYVIIGHSERRQYFNETNETVNKKVLKAVESDITPIICVGESLAEREQGVTKDLVRYQVKIALLGLTKDQAEKVIIAYEPIWAIGTGKTATKEQANEVCAIIRDTIREVYDNETAEKIHIQYGGSVNTKTAKDLFEMSDIDGGLIGGASLKLDDFEKIAKYNMV